MSERADVLLEKETVLTEVAFYVRAFYPKHDEHRMEMIEAALASLELSDDWWSRRASYPIGRTVHDMLEKYRERETIAKAVLQLEERIVQL